ncbi:hypothetical protein ABIG06_003483 [Bradyrhizobium sp. USDA 326]
MSPMTAISWRCSPQTSSRVRDLFQRLRDSLCFRQIKHGSAAMPISRLISGINFARDQQHLFESGLNCALRKLGLVESIMAIQTATDRKRVIEVHSPGVTDALAVGEMAVREISLSKEGSMLGGRCRYVFSALIGKMKRMSTHPSRCLGSDRAYASPARARQLNLREAIGLLFGQIDRPINPNQSRPLPLSTPSSP